MVSDDKAEDKWREAQEQNLNYRYSNFGAILKSYMKAPVANVAHWRKQVVTHLRTAGLSCDAVEIGHFIAVDSVADRCRRKKATQEGQSIPIIGFSKLYRVNVLKKKYFIMYRIVLKYPAMSKNV